jgi:hypothetical protein
MSWRGRKGKARGLSAIVEKPAMALCLCMPMQKGHTIVPYLSEGLPDLSQALEAKMA